MDYCEIGDCKNCSWWEYRICTNPDANYMEPMDPYDGCTLCDHEGETDHV